MLFQLSHRLWGISFPLRFGLADKCCCFQQEKALRHRVTCVCWFAADLSRPRLGTTIPQPQGMACEAAAALHILNFNIIKDLWDSFFCWRIVSFRSIQNWHNQSKPISTNVAQLCIELKQSIRFLLKTRGILFVFYLFLFHLIEITRNWLHVSWNDWLFCFA